MALLLKREGSPYWIAAFDVTMPDGSTRRLKKSTKRTKRAEAMIEAIRLEDAATKEHRADQGDAGQAYAILSEAAAAAAKGELSEGRSRELIARLCEISNGSPLRFYTVRTWAADWLSVKAATGKKSTLSRYTGHLKAFLEWLGPRADAKLESITKAEIRAFRDAIRTGWTSEPTQPPPARKPKNAEPDPKPFRTARTVNLYAADVASMFRSAVREGLLLASPASAIDRLPEHDSTEREVFTVAEVARMVAAASDPAWQLAAFSTPTRQAIPQPERGEDWQGMIFVGFYAGARLGDCSRLTWKNFNLERRTLSFMPAKTERKRKRLEVPLHPRLIAWLETRAASVDPAGPLFPTLRAEPISGRKGLSFQFVAIMEAAGIDRGTIREAKKGQRAAHARGFHSLRHSLTSTLANLDVSEEIRRRIVGHESAEVHAGYTHHERETLARAVERMPSI